MKQWSSLVKDESEKKRQALWHRLQDKILDIYLTLKYQIDMHIITRKKILDFAEKHPEYATDLDAWFQIVKHTAFGKFAELRRVFPSADQVGGFTVFNIDGNKVRLIAAVHYNTQRLFWCGC